MPPSTSNGFPVTFLAGGSQVLKPGEDDLRSTNYIEPADNVEYILGAIFESQKRSGGSRPDLFGAAFLVRRYRSEVGTV
jgi:hypothetical protein